VSEFDPASHENAQRVWKALVAFGAPLDQITVEDLTASGVVSGEDRVILRTSMISNAVGSLVLVLALARDNRENHQ
jgi:hypothetical protein